jgi:hypothetical protein
LGPKDFWNEGSGEAREEMDLGFVHEDIDMSWR